MNTKTPSPEQCLEHDVTSLTSVGQIRAQLMSGAIPLDKVDEVVRAGLQATIRFNRKCGNKVEVVERPDYATRLKYLQFLTETVEGMPIKRQEIITKKLPSETELKDTLARSPALRKALKKSLEEAEQRATGKEPA